MSAERARADAIPAKVTIFVTVGTELPFDRLVRAVDAWAHESGVHGEVFAQIGATDRRPEYIAAQPFLDPQDFRRVFEQADLVVGHAGMGTILSSLTAEKPLLVMPRRASAGEHRNDHQLATAQYFTELDMVNVALDEAALVRMLDRREELTAKGTIATHASKSLTDAIRRVIEAA